MNLQPPRFLPLEPGDRLSRAEFEARYAAMPGLKKAELVEGVVHMASAVRLPQHGSPHGDLMTGLGTYRAHTPGVLSGDNTTIRLDLDNEPQPDALLLIEPALGGQARIDDDGYVSGGPELVAEVTASSASIDLHDKLEAYRRNGVREYIVWRVLDRALDWFVLGKGRYQPLPLTEGTLRSEAFPGLWLDPEALIRGDLASVLQTLQQGLATPEHTAFVDHLRQAGPP